MSYLTQFRLFLCIPALLLGLFLAAQVRQIPTNYWLITDGQQGMALITEEHSKRVLEYTYTVNQVQYFGEARSDWQGKYSKVHPGEEATVYYSASRPDLSGLYKPVIAIEGSPALLVFIIFESLIISTIVNPHGKWALRLTE